MIRFALDCIFVARAESAPSAPTAICRTRAGPRLRAGVARAAGTRLVLHFGRLALGVRGIAADSGTRSPGSSGYGRARRAGGSRAWRVSVAAEAGVGFSCVTALTALRGARLRRRTPT